MKKYSHEEYLEYMKMISAHKKVKPKIGRSTYYSDLVILSVIIFLMFFFFMLAISQENKPIPHNEGAPVREVVPAPVEEEEDSAIIEMIFE